MDYLTRKQMIKVQRLGKRYDGQLAARDLSFDAVYETGRPNHHTRDRFLTASEPGCRDHSKVVMPPGVLQLEHPDARIGIKAAIAAFCATKRTVQRARPSGGLLHTIAIKRCFWLSSSTSAAPGRDFSYSARSKPPC